jgi:hypothetical protein
VFGIYESFVQAARTTEQPDLTREQLRALVEQLEAVRD